MARFLLVLVILASSSAIATMELYKKKNYVDTVYCFNFFWGNSAEFGETPQGRYELIHLELVGVNFSLPSPLRCSSRVEPNGRYEREIVNCNHTSGAKVEMVQRVWRRTLNKIHVDVVYGDKTYSIPNCL